jgi:hypothetical protein
MVHFSCQGKEMKQRIGIKLKVASDTRESAIDLLKKCIHEIEIGRNSMFYPLPDDDDTEADISVVILDNNEGVYDSWSHCWTLHKGV